MDKMILYNLMNVGLLIKMNGQPCSYKKQSLRCDFLPFVALKCFNLGKKLIFSYCVGVMRKSQIVHP